MSKYSEKLTLQLDYNFLRNPAFVLFTYCMIMIPGFLIGCGFEVPEMFGLLLNDSSICVPSFISEIFIGESIISLLLVIVVFELLRILKGPFRLEKFPNRASGVLAYELRVLAVLSIGAIAYAAITSVAVLINEMSGSTDLQNLSFSYHKLVQIVLAGFVMINVKLFFDLRIKKKNLSANYIEAFDAFGRVALNLNTVNWFEKRGRYYYAFGDSFENKVTNNLKELELRLGGKNFVRVNRSAIVNIDIIDNYSYWENEKYILRTVIGKEFVVSRKRMKSIKELARTKEVGSG